MTTSTVKRYDKRDPDGRRYKIYRSKDGSERKVYLNQARGRALSSVWSDIPSFQTVNNTGEYVDYPTQKPVALVERIARASCPPNGMLLDPFAGCATACIAAEKLGLEWVGIDLSPIAYDLVRERLAREVSVGHEDKPSLTGWDVTHRTDIPKRTDIDAPKNYRENKHILYGMQEGICKGCQTHFPFKIFEVDHIVPKTRGGTNHLDNLQLLCGHCNRIKGDRPMAYLLAELRVRNMIAVG